MSTLSYKLIFLLLSLCLSSAGQEVYRSDLPDVDASSVGVYIENLETGNVVFDVNGELPMTPASVTKLVTAASVLQHVDTAYRYHTLFVADGPVADGVLNGNIRIIPSGDPTLESCHFPDYAGVADSVANAMLDMGIRKVRGQIIVEAGTETDFSIPFGWTDSDAVWPYGAGHHALNYKDNRVLLSMPSATIEPAVPGVKIMRVKKRRGAPMVSRKPSDMTVTVCCGPKQRVQTNIANPSPEAAFAHAFRLSLNAHGIDVVGQNLGEQKGSGQTLYVHLSPSVVDILRSMMIRSDNLMAEASLRLLAPGRSRADALNVEMQTWVENGIDVGGMKINDGSGLSRSNAISPYVLADVLVWMLDNSQYVNEYISMFPVAGVSGTLRSFLKGTDLEGRFVAKTGSVDGVQCYAGYLLNEYGMPTHVVVVMVNGFTCSRAALKSSIEEMLLEKLL